VQPGWAADEILHHLLGFSGLARGFEKLLDEPPAAVGGRLAHQPQHRGGEMFGGDFKPAADMMMREFFDIGARFLGKGEIEP
jgi:hypothetical protein